MRSMLSCAMTRSVAVLAGVLITSSPHVMAGDISAGLGGGGGWQSYGAGIGASAGGWEAGGYGGGAELNSIGHYGAGMLSYGGGDFGGYDGGHGGYGGGGHGGFGGGGHGGFGGGGHGGFGGGDHGGYGGMGDFGGFELGGGGGGHSFENELAGHEDQAALSAVGLASLLTGGGLGGAHAHLAASGGGSSYTISGPTQEIKSLHKIQTTNGGGHVISRTAGHGGGAGKAIIVVKQPVIASHGGGHGWH